MHAKRTLNILYCVLFSLFLILPLCFFNFTGTLSSENRKLAVFPAFPTSLADTTSFTQGVETWLEDRIGFRKKLVTLYRYMELYCFGISPSKIVALGSDGTAFLLEAQGSAVKHAEIFEAVGETAERTSLYPQQLDLLKRTAATAKKSPQSVVLLAVPTSPLFRFDNLPKYVRMNLTPKTPETHPVSRALADFAAMHPDDAKYFLFPFQESVKLTETYPLYPQKNFHWSWSPFTVAVSEMIAERFSQPLSRRFIPEDFSPCTTNSDLSHLVGVPSFKNINDLCPSNAFYTGQEITQSPLSEVFPGPEATRTTSGTYYKNAAVASGKVLVIGDSFNYNLGLPLVRNFREVVVLDYYGVMRETQNTPLPVLHHLKEAYNPKQIVIVRHNFFMDIQWSSGLDVFLR
ncbi:MAG: hypothetical protein LBD10_00040 [Desulfobulbus sp.]|jgi:hypothetical protein|uniref:hypothetical protein n=1 Tax=Desulfobulbus sp. TaxID=895 RepID=UPI0028490B98|nr:hypothetical protein [Desulfobulbus sp.]MDR2548594.1 hypothetical protein [Desulfobulbus sp.]